MDWQAKIFNYCERGSSGAFWAEPLNAISNGAFLLAALVAVVHMLTGRERRHGIAEWALAGLVVVIGIGSFLFHTLATRWSAIADVAPIGVFMLAYFVYALRRFARLNWLLVAAALALFVLALRYAGQIQCRPQLLSVTAAARGRCLNGTLAYAPAFVALIGVGALLALRRHPAWRYLVGAGLVFLASMFFRTVDLELCAATRLAGRTIGTHALWHMLNALTLYILLLAATRHGSPPAHPGPPSRPRAPRPGDSP